MSNEMLFETNDITLSNRKLHTPSDFARKNLLYIQEVGNLKSLKPHVSKREKLESYLFFVVIKGSGKVTIGEKEYHVTEGDGIFIDCMKPYQHISDEENPWELAWVHFNGVNAEGYYNMFIQKNNGMPSYSLGKSKKYTKIIENVMDNQDDKDTMSELKTALLLTELLTMIIGDVSSNPGRKEEKLLSKLREVINERFQEENLFEKLCIEFNLDEMKINEEYKNKYGIDLCDYILNRRFTYAKELLRFTIKPVKEVVQESGICNSDLFRHLFIENEGMTAEEYRKKWSQWNR